jgi:hypothetical protein
MSEFSSSESLICQLVVTRATAFLYVMEDPTRQTQKRGIVRNRLLHVFISALEPTDHSSSTESFQTNRFGFEYISVLIPTP